MTKGKKIWITIATVFTLALTAPEKLAVTTYEVGELETTDGTKKNVIEVKYFSNENHNGLEMLEICWNDYRDEDRDAFYSQGMQYVANSVDDKLSFEYNRGKLHVEQRSWLFGGVQKAHYDGSYLPGESSQYFNYVSDDDWATRGVSSFVPISVESKFLINVGEDLYYIGFKSDDNMIGENETLEERHEKLNSELNLVGTSKRMDGLYSFTARHYEKYDPFTFAKRMYEYMQARSAGENEYVSTLEIANFFDYYKYNGSTYEKETNNTEIVKVTNLFVDYYQIKFTKSADGARVASDSMFGAVAGNSAFNLTGEYQSSQYLVGRTIVNAYIENFDLIRVDENYYALKLKSNFDNFYKTYKDDIRLSICIELDILKDQDIEFFGFTVDSGLDKYTILECYTLETVDGEIVRTEVDV